MALEGLIRCAKYHEGLSGLYSKTPRAPDLQEHRGETVSEGRHATYAPGCIRVVEPVSRRCRRGSMGA